MSDLIGRNFTQSTSMRKEDANKGGSITANNPASSKKGKRNTQKLAGLDSIVYKVVSPAEIYQCLASRTPDNTSTATLKFLTSLFFHYAGPYAFLQIGRALLAFYRTQESDCTSVGGRIRALDRIDLANPIEQRAILVGLCEDRFERQETWVYHNSLRRSQCTSRTWEHRSGHSRKVRNRGDIAVLRGLVTCAYPSLKPRDAKYCFYKERL